MCNIILGKHNLSSKSKNIFSWVFFYIQLTFLLPQEVILAEGRISYTTYIIMVAVRLHLTTDQIVI